MNIIIKIFSKPLFLLFNFKQAFIVESPILLRMLVFDIYP